MLSITVFHNIVTDVLPQVSDVVPVIGTLILNFYRDIANKSKLPIFFAPILSFLKQSSNFDKIHFYTSLDV